MIVTYLFSSPEGDISLDPDDLARPLLVTPEKAHPQLPLGDYFDTIRKCILKDEGELLEDVFKNTSHKSLNLNDILEIKIRSEKHGVLYHLASVEVIAREIRAKFTLSTAISRKAVECILQEHDILNRLNHHFQLSFLPEIYGIRKMTCHTVCGTEVELVMLAAQWFEDYHEWHVAKDPANGELKLQIWDLKRGPRYASISEASMIIEECSRILALYYDFEDFSQIGQWHHAAGDFIVTTGKNRKPDVRLTTVRKYTPLMPVFSEKNFDPGIAVLYFFLHTTLKMRLDRLDGVGEKVWLEDFAVTATVKGLFEGLHTREAKGESSFPVDKLPALMKSFDRDELRRVFEPLLNHLWEQDSEEAVFISIHLDSHISSVCRAFQDLH